MSDDKTPERKRLAAMLAQANATVADLKSYAESMQPGSDLLHATAEEMGLDSEMEVIPALKATVARLQEELAAAKVRGKAKRRAAKGGR